MDVYMEKLELKARLDEKRYRIKQMQAEEKKEREQQTRWKRVAELHSQISIVGGWMTRFAEPLYQGGASYQGGGGGTRQIQHKDYTLRFLFFYWYLT
mmetsp:Transcript_26115/g.60040  ORF Transcript_26115/g.60040 Transcript_26115/m.60040 type:complete len:97 (-) Transcript_26115:484-774(-)